MTVDQLRAEFLGEMSRRHQNLVVWKHLDRALLGQGDIDSAAPASDIAAICSDAIAIASNTLQATHVICCTHVADKRNLYFAQPDRLPQLFEFDVCLQPSRGLSPWADPRSLVELSAVRADGIRALRPGAEAVVSLVYHGISREGRHRLVGDELEIVRKGVALDLESARIACALLPPRPARRAMRSVLDAVADGGWDEASARRAFAGFVVSGVAHPVFTTRRLSFRAGRALGRQCVMSVLARKHGRVVQETGLDQLLQDARRSGHDVLELG